MQEEKQLQIPQPTSSAMTIPEPNNQTTNLKTYSYRYMCAVLFILAALVNSFPTNTLTAASAVAERVYDETKPTIALCSLADNLMIPFVLFPALYLLDHVGLKAAMNIACLSMCIGSLIRLCINSSFGGYVFGTFVTTVGSIILLSAPIKFVSSWFPMSEVSFHNHIGVASECYSDVFVVLVRCSWHLYECPFHRRDIYQRGLSGTGHCADYNRSRCEPACSVLLPRKAAIATKVEIDKRSRTSQQAEQRFCKSVCQLVKNLNYVWLFISASLTRGAVAGLLAVLSWVVQPYGFDSRDVGYMIISTTVSGIVGCVLVGVLLKRTRKYKLISGVCVIAGLFLIGMWLLAFETSNSLAPACIVAGLCGLFLFPFFTTTAELATQIAFPVGDATSSGIVFAGGELLGFVAGMILEAVVDGTSRERSRAVVGTSMGCIALGAVFLFFVKEDLRKHRFEEDEDNREQELEEVNSQKISQNE